MQLLSEGCCHCLCQTVKDCFAFCHSKQEAKQSMPDHQMFLANEQRSAEWHSHQEQTHRHQAVHYLAVMTLPPVCAAAVTCQFSQKYHQQ